jgi:hypothetical protein|uniref:hypothetical protein n=1 Tax=Coprococcus sp. TaxID=2049024 RepID=UPI0040287C49
MKISSSLKKIISFMLVSVLAVNAVVLPVSAAESTTEETEKAEVQFDFSRGYYSDPADLKYTGELSDNLTSKFNVRQEYDMSFTMNDYYYSAPFCFYVGDGTDPIQMFTGDNQKYGEGFSYSYLQSATATFFKENELSLSDYDVYYYGVVGRSSGKGVFSLNYLLIPHGKRIAFCNSSYKNEFDNGYSVWGFYAKGSSFASRNGNDKNNSIVHVRRYMNASYGKIQDSCNWAEYSSNCVYDGALYYPINCDKGFYDTQYACMNIPVFNTIEDTGLYVNEIRDPTPDNKAPAEEPEPEEKVGADAFYWDSLKCKLVRDGDNYKVVFDYRYSVPDMVANPSDYVMYVDVTQDYKYKAKNNSNILNGQSKVTSTSCDIGASPGRVSCDSALFYAEAYGNSLGSFCVFGATAVSDLLGHGYDWADITFYNSYISVYVELVHNYPADSSSLRVKDKVSSDIRSFTFDALTLKSIDDISDIDSTENEVNVKTKDTVDDTGKVTDRRVESVVVNDTTTNQTINNYYYDGNGNKSDNSSGNGSALNDILSGLISFIKTLVTEGLPAAIEILKTVIKSISDLVSSALDGLNVGEGSSNGIIAVLKCIPASCWSLVVIAVIILVVVGVLKHIF